MSRAEVQEVVKSGNLYPRRTFKKSTERPVKNLSPETLPDLRADVTWFISPFPRFALVNEMSICRLVSQFAQYLTARVAEKSLMLKIQVSSQALPLQDYLGLK